MRLSYTTLAVSAGVAVIAAVCVPLESWKALQSGLLPALSVIAAATLVRLARGLPFTNPAQFTLDGIRETSAAFLQLARALRALIFVSLAAMLWLSISPAIVNAVGEIPSVRPHLSEISRPVSASIGLVLAYAVMRMTQVVQGDVALVKLQGRLLEQAVTTKAAEEFTKASVPVPGSIAGSKGFGTPLH